MNSRSLPSTVFVVAALLMACDRDPEGDGAALGLVPVAPDTKEAIVISGEMAEPMKLHRYEAPPGAPLPFSTYLPEGFGVEPLELSEGEWGLRFAPAAEIDAALDLVIHPAGTTEEAGRTRVAEIARELSTRTDAPGTPGGWGLVEHRFRGRSIRGSVTLGEHDGRFFHIVTRYLPEHGETFRARAAWIIEEWVWEDSGEGLFGSVGF